MAKQSEKYRFRITLRRQITIPRRLLEALKLREGDSFEVIIAQSGRTMIRSLRSDSPGLFPDSTIETLKKRAAQIDAGQYCEVHDIATFARIKSSTLKARVAGASKCKRRSKNRPRHAVRAGDAAE